MNDTDRDRLNARMEGAKAALEGRKMDANTYDESEDLHFEWLAAWADTRMAMMQRNRQNVQGVPAAAGGTEPEN